MQIELGSVMGGFAACLVAFVATVAYAISARNQADRANEKCDSLGKQISEIRGKHDSLDSKIVERLSAIETSLARIQGQLSVTSKDE